MAACLLSDTMKRTTTAILLALFAGNLCSNPIGPSTPLSQLPLSGSSLAGAISVFKGAEELLTQRQLISLSQAEAVWGVDSAQPCDIDVNATTVCGKAKPLRGVTVESYAQLKVARESGVLTAALITFEHSELREARSDGRTCLPMNDVITPLLKSHAAKTLQVYVGGPTTTAPLVVFQGSMYSMSVQAGSRIECVRYIKLLSRSNK